MKNIKHILMFISVELVYWFNTLLNYIRFKIAKAKANQKHKLTGKRYHVVPFGKELVVVDNTFIDYYNKIGRDKKGFKKITIDLLLKWSYYSTSVESVTHKNPKK